MIFTRSRKTDKDLGSKAAQVFIRLTDDKPGFAGLALTLSTLSRGARAPSFYCLTDAATMVCCDLGRSPAPMPADLEVDMT